MNIQDLFFDIRTLINQSKQNKTTDKIITELFLIPNVEIEKDKIDYGLFEIINYFLELFGIDKLTEKEYIQLLNIDFFNNINIPKKYIDYLIIIKIFALRIIKKIIEYRKLKMLEVNSDNNNIRQDWDGQDISLKENCRSDIKRD